MLVFYYGIDVGSETQLTQLAGWSLMETVRFVDKSADSPSFVNLTG
jgi:hypothetical protein